MVSPAPGDGPGRTRARFLLYLDAIVCAFLGLVALSGANGFADLFDIPTWVPRAVGIGTLVWAAILVGLTRVPAWRTVLGVVVVVNIVAGGTLLGLAPSAPDGGGQTVLIVVAVLVGLIAIAQAWARGPAPGRHVG